MKDNAEDKIVHTKTTISLPIRHVFNKVSPGESMKKYYIRLNGYHARK